MKPWYNYNWVFHYRLSTCSCRIYQHKRMIYYVHLFIMHDTNIQAYLAEYKPSHTSLVVTTELQSIPPNIYDYIAVTSSSQQEVLYILHKIYHNIKSGSVLHWFDEIENGPLIAFQSWSSSVKHLQLHPFPVQHWNERAFIVHKLDDYDAWSDT